MAWPSKRQDLLWAGYLVLLAVAFGLLQHWPLVRLAQRGELSARLEQLRQQRREAQFQGVRTVNLAQAHTLWQEGQSLFIDTRDRQEYEELHIPGAINLSPDSWSELKSSPLLGVPRDRRLIVYCSQERCDAALKVAEKLQTLGFTQVMAFLGGFRSWDEAGYPVDTRR
ncbi:MAG: rhodanese-like domain-containing protein [Thermodesulfobacteriota bacterium]